MKMKFDHIGIAVKNLEKGMKLIKDLFGWELPKKGPYSTPLGEPNRYCMISANGIYIELFERSEEKEGEIIEFCVEVDNIEECYDKMKEKGLTPIDLPPGKKYRFAASGSKIFYLPEEKVQGMRIEFLERDFRAF